MVGSRLTHLQLLACASSCAITACCAAQCSLILGYDLYGNDLLGPDGKPAPQNVSGPAACCDLCSTKPQGTIPKGVCKGDSSPTANSHVHFPRFHTQPFPDRPDSTHSLGGATKLCRCGSLELQSRYKHLLDENGPWQLDRMRPKQAVPER